MYDPFSQVSEFWGIVDGSDVKCGVSIEVLTDLLGANDSTRENVFVTNRPVFERIAFYKIENGLFESDGSIKVCKDDLRK